MILIKLTETIDKLLRHNLLFDKKTNNHSLPALHSGCKLGRNETLMLVLH